MRYVNYKLTLYEDTVIIPLNRPCKCNVGLVEISMAEINSTAHDGNAIDITCEQINSTFDNPDRLLRRIPFNRLRKNEYYHTWTAKYVQMKAVDSDDRFLKLKVRRTDDNSSLTLGSLFQDNVIFVTLAFSDVELAKTWASCI